MIYLSVHQARMFDFNVHFQVQKEQEDGECLLRVPNFSWAVYLIA